MIRNNHGRDDGLKPILRDETGTTWLAPEHTSPRYYLALFGLTGREVDFLDWDDQNARYRLQHMHYRHRDYSPAIGRFMQHDPLGVDMDWEMYNDLDPFAQYADGMNIYQYVESSPAVFIDPYGYGASTIDQPGTLPVTKDCLEGLCETLPKPNPFPWFPPIPPKTPPKCPADESDCTSEEQAALQAAVNAACKSGGDWSCNGGDTDISVVRNKLSRNKACARARTSINNRCFKGGDKGHQQAEKDAWQAAYKCAEELQKLMRKSKAV